MGLLSKVKRNEVILGFEDYCFLLRGTEKSGKTSFYADLVREFYKDPTAGLLIPFEKGYSAISDINVFPYTILNKVRIDGIEKDGWDVFSELVNELVETKNENGIKIVCIDTVDEFFKVAIEKIKRLSIIETGKPCKSINDAFGGFGRGRERLATLIKEQTQKLRGAGYGVMYIGHTKYKTLKTKYDETEYNILGSNLSEDYDKMIANDADMILMITQEPKIVKNEVVGNERKLRLRSDGFYAAGSRFKDVPETIECSAKAFIEAFTNAIKSAAHIKNDKELKEKIEEQHKHNIVETINEDEEKEKIIQGLKSHKWKDGEQSEFMGFIKSMDIKLNLKSPKDNDLNDLKNLVDKFNIIY